MKTENILITIIILIILVMLAGIIASRFVKPDLILKSDRARTRMSLIETAIDTYYINTTQYPVKIEDLLNCPIGLENVWKGPYLKLSQATDPWNRLYIYEPNQTNPNGYVIISYGEDGLPGGEGYDADIYND